MDQIHFGAIYPFSQPATGPGSRIGHLAPAIDGSFTTLETAVRCTGRSDGRFSAEAITLANAGGGRDCRPPGRVPAQGL